MAGMVPLIQNSEVASWHSKLVLNGQRKGANELVRMSF